VASGWKADIGDLSKRLLYSEDRVTIKPKSRSLAFQGGEKSFITSSKLRKWDWDRSLRLGARQDNVCFTAPTGEIAC
jgi:hypothetical protein